MKTHMLWWLHVASIGLAGLASSWPFSNFRLVRSSDRPIV